MMTVIIILVVLLIGAWCYFTNNTKHISEGTKLIYRSYDYIMKRLFVGDPETIRKMELSDLSPVVKIFVR